MAQVADATATDTAAAPYKAPLADTTTATAAATDTTADTTQEDASGKKALVDRIVAVIEQASAKGVSKHKIVKFLKNQQEITQQDINRGYERYYEKHNLYEMTFTEDKMGFSVIMDPHGKNAIVSSIQEEANTKPNPKKGNLKPLRIASRIVEIHGTNVEGWQHRKILDKIQQQKTRPFFIVFRAPHNDSSLSKLKKKEDLAHKFLNEDDLAEMFGDDDSSVYSSDGSGDEDESKEEEDPDVAAVKQHTQRKLDQRNKHLVTVATMKDLQWQDDEVAEMEARLKEMMEAQNLATLDENTTKALTHKRRETLMSLLDAQTDDNSSVSGGPTHSASSSGYPLRMGQNRSNSSLSVSYGPGHYSQYSDDQRAHAYRVQIMNQLATEHPDWTVEQIRQMANQLQEQQRQNSQVLYEQTKGAKNLEAFIQSVPTMGAQGGPPLMANGMVKPVTPSTRAMQAMWTPPQQMPSQQSVEQKTDDRNVSSRDLLDQMRKGCVMFKRTTKGKLVPRWVEFSPDFTRLRWYSPRKGKSIKTTSVNLARIQKIHVGKQSSVTLQDKSTAFTLEYLDKNDNVGTLTLVAESQQQAFLWFQAIKMCGDASKRGNAMNTAESSAKLAKMVAEKNPNANRSVVLDLPGSDSKPPTVNDLEKLLKRANDLYKKVLPLIQGKKGIVMKSLKKKYPQRPVGALDPNVPRNQKSAEALEYEDIHNSIENVKKEMVDKYGKNLSDYRYLLDKLMVEDDEDVDQTRDSQLRELKISLFLMINELVSLKVKLVAIARRFQSSGL